MIRRIIMHLHTYVYETKTLKQFHRVQKDMIREIRKYGDPVLFAKAETIDRIGQDELDILSDMWDTMLHNKCVGLSAPQIGISKRLFIVNAGGVTIKGANPEVLKEGTLIEDTEGSPCIPGVHKPVRRPGKITCRYLDESGEIVKTELKGVAARAFLHEKDHHDGILFIDHLKPIQKRLILKSFANQTLINHDDELSIMTPTPTREEIQEVAKKIRPSIEKIAIKNGWILNENKDIADSTIEGLARNKLIHGKRFCPCRIPTGDAEADKIYLCPCRDAATDIEAEGHCHCYLYMKKQ